MGGRKGEGSGEHLGSLLNGSLLEGLDQSRDLIIIILGGDTGLGSSGLLVGLSKATEGSQRVRSELVQDTGDELSHLLLLTTAVDGVGVGGDAGVNYRITSIKTKQVGRRGQSMAWELRVEGGVSLKIHEVLGTCLLQG